MVKRRDSMRAQHCSTMMQAVASKHLRARKKAMPPVPATFAVDSIDVLSAPERYLYSSGWQPGQD